MGDDVTRSWKFFCKRVMASPALGKSFQAEAGDCLARSCLKLEHCVVFYLVDLLRNHYNFQL
jgi:hypothetical protein